MENNITSKHKDYNQLEAQLQFEQLITNLSATFINLPVNEIDRQINIGLKLVVNALQVERSTLFQYSQDDSDWLITNSFAQKGFKATPRVSIQENFPYIFSKIQTGEIIEITSLNDLPKEAALDRKNLALFNVKSTLLIPISAGGSFDFVLTLGSLKQERSWPCDLIPRLQLIGEVFANALMRKNHYLKLQKSLKELNDRLRFEEFISKLSTQFLNLPYKKVDDIIINGLKQIVEFLKIDRCSLIKFSEDFKGLSTKYTYAADDTLPVSNIQEIEEKYQSVIKQLRRGITVSFSSQDELPVEIKDDLKKSDIISGIAIPIKYGNSHYYGLFISTVYSKRNWPESTISRLTLCGQILSNALERKIADNEIKLLLENLEADNTYLKEELRTISGFKDIIGKSISLNYVFNRIRSVAPTDTTVLIEGETGTGKELVTRALHQESLRKNKHMVTVGCAALPSSLIESELFGHEKGAFTGAVTMRQGRFEIANNGTLFLDEIGELSLELQAKLLRVIEEGEFERLGSSKTLKVDVRIIAATNRILEDEVKKGRFREDLYYRLSTFVITVPPLRERKGDIPLLVNYFISQYSKKTGKTITRVPKATIKILEEYSWPGNVRELRNVIEHSVIVSKNGILNIGRPLLHRNNDSGKLKLEDVERDHILKVLKKTGWRIAGKSGAAEMLGLKRTTLQSRMKKLGIEIHR